jgi:hypothetical protein
VIRPTRAAGLAAYPDAAALEDRNERGEVTAKRADSATYVFEREGEYRLGEITIHWWDPDQKELKQAKLPERVLRVRAGPETVPASGTQTGSSPAQDADAEQAGSFVWWITAAAVVIIAGVSLWVVSRRYGGNLRTALSLWRQKRAESEPAYFRRFESACRANDPGQAMQALLAWLGRREDFSGQATVYELCRRGEDPDLGQAADELGRLLFGSDSQPHAGPAWQGAPLANLVAQARRRLQQTSALRCRADVLPPLNPQSPAGTT